MQYPPDAVSALTQHRHKQYYDGSEIVVAGRIADNKLGVFKADVKAQGVNGGPQKAERPDNTQRSLQAHAVLQGSPFPRIVSLDPHVTLSKDLGNGQAGMGRTWPQLLVLS